MMDEHRDEYGFCPKCGAVMQNGVCQSCGYGKWRGSQTDAAGAYGNIPRKKRMSAGTKAVIILTIVLAVLLIVFAFFSVRAVKNWEYSSDPVIGDGFFDGFDGSYDDFDIDDNYGSYDDYEAYVPGPDDEYYVEFTDATAKGLSYEIDWQDLYLYPDDEDKTEYYSATCPVVIGADVEKLDAVNKKIREVVCKYQNTYKDYACGVNITSYVTYMDEERMSVVVQEELYGEDESEFKVDAVTFDMTTGEVIPYADMVQVDEELVKKFRSQDSIQNGGVEFVTGSTDEELLSYLSDEDKYFVFLTPVGREIGFNYDDGWVTVTLKDNAL